MNKQYALVALVGGFILSGCAGLSTSTIAYQEPTDRTPPSNSIIVKDTFSNTWDRLIGRLAEQYFVINNVEKTSRIMNVSFSSGSPNDFIDCGTSTRVYIPGPGVPGGEQRFTYEVAGPSANYLRTIPNTLNPNFQIPVRVNRTTKIEGRTNIYLAPKGKNGTKVSVNTKYILTIDKNFSDLVGRRLNTQNPPPVTFNTKDIFRRSGDAGELQCISRGTIENDIIRAAQKG